MFTGLLKLAVTVVCVNWLGFQCTMLPTLVYVSGKPFEQQCMCSVVKCDYAVKY